MRAYPHLVGKMSDSELRELHAETFKPILSLGEPPPKANGGYLTAFKDTYTPFTGSLTQATLKKAMGDQLRQVGGADHRVVEFVEKSTKKHKGKPVYNIITGS